MSRLYRRNCMPMQTTTYLCVQTVPTCKCRPVGTQVRRYWFSPMLRYLFNVYCVLDNGYNCVLDNGYKLNHCRSDFLKALWNFKNKNCNSQNAAVFRITFINYKIVFEFVFLTIINRYTGCPHLSFH